MTADDRRRRLLPHRLAPVRAKSIELRTEAVAPEFRISALKAATQAVDAV